MGGKSKQKSSTVSTQNASSAPLTPDELTSYFDELNEQTKSSLAPDGRLFRFAASGTPGTAYRAPTDASIKSLGGLGAQRRQTIDRSRAEAMDEIDANPALSIFQAQRSKQLTNRDAVEQQDALDREIEAAIGQLAFERADRQYAADKANNDRLKEDMAILAEIFFGGKGQKSESTASSTSQSKGSSLSLDNPFSFGFSF